MSQLAANPSVRRFVSDWTAPPKPVESVNVAREWFAPPKAPAPAFVSAPSAPVSAPEPQPVTPADLEAWRQRYPDARNIPDDQLAAALAEHRRNPSGTLQAPQPLTGAAGFGRNFGNQMGLALRSFPATSGLMTPEFGQQDFTERQPGEGVGGFVGSAVGSALRSAPALALGPAGGVVAIAPLVSEAAGQKMRSVQDQGGTIPQQVISGVGAGLTEAATEYIPIPFLKKLAEMPIKGAGRIGAKALQLLGIAAVEGSEEVASTIGQNVVDAADGVQTWEQAAQNIARDAPMAFAGGAIGGAAVSAPVLTAQSALNRRSIGAQSEPGVQPIEPGVSPEEKPIPGGFGKMSGPLPVNLPEPTPAPVEPQPVPEPSLDDVISEILAEREAVRTTVPTANQEPQPVGQVPLPEQAQGEGRGQPVVEQRVTGQEQAAPQPESLPDPSSMSMKALREELKNAGVAKPPSKKSELVAAVSRLRSANPSGQMAIGEPDAGSTVPLDQGVSGVVAGERQAPTEPSGVVERVVKQPWETPLAQYVGAQPERMAEGLKNAHRIDVTRAVRSGLPVPSSVLADYPDLQAKAKTNEPKQDVGVMQPWEMTQIEAIGPYKESVTAEDIRRAEKSTKASRQKFERNTNRGGWVPPPIKAEIGGKIVQREDDVAAMREQYRANAADYRAKAEAHYEAVSQALAAGKPVPPAVLADYPDLQAKAKTNEPKQDVGVKQPWEMTKEEVDSLSYKEFEAVDQGVAKEWADLYWRDRLQKNHPGDDDLRKKISVVSDYLHERGSAFKAERKAEQDEASSAIEAGEPWRVRRGRFVQHHRTGGIPDDAYAQYLTRDGIGFLGDRSRYPDMRGGKNGVEYRSGEDRGKDLIVAFDAEGPIGWVSNEFGAPGVWVIQDYQRRGIGTDLLSMWMRERPRTQKIGQMTSSGKEMARSYHKRLVSEAVAAGKPVPPAVLADYPDLKPKGTPKQPQESTTQNPAQDTARKIELYEDAIRTKKDLRQSVPPEWYEKLSALRGAGPSEVSGMLVFGHPEATNVRPDKYSNLIPIVAKDSESIERREQKTQQLIDELQSRVMKRKGSKPLTTEEEAILDMLRTETMPELKRMREALGASAPNLADYPDLQARAKTNEPTQAPLPSPTPQAQEFDYETTQSTAEDIGLSDTLAEAVPESGAALEENDTGGYDLVFDRPVTLAEGKRLRAAGWVKNKARHYTMGEVAKPEAIPDDAKQMKMADAPDLQPSTRKEAPNAQQERRQEGRKGLLIEQPGATPAPVQSGSDVAPTESGAREAKEAKPKPDNKQHHVAVYNGKSVPIDYGDAKSGFKIAAQRISDNGADGYVITPKGEVFSVIQGRKTARRVTGPEADRVKSGQIKEFLHAEPTSLADKLGNIEQAAKERRAARKIKRGKNIGASTLPGDAVDFIIETAAGAAKDLVLTASAIRQLVVEKIPEHLRPYLKEIQTRVVRLVQTSLNEEGTAVSPKAFRENYRSAVAPEPSNTRVARLKEYSAGSRGVIKGLQDVIRRAKKVGGKDEAARSLAIRKEVAKLVRENMPPQYRGALLSEVAKAKDLKGIARAIGRMESVLLRGETRRLAGNIKKRTGKKRLKKFTQERRDRLREIRAEAESLARGLRQDVPVKGGAVASAAGSTASTKPRRKAAPLKDVRAAHSRMRDISEEALTIAADQRNEREIEVLGRKQEVAQLVSEAKAGLAKRKPLPPGDTPEATEASRRQRWVRALLTPDSLARTLDSDFNGGGVFHRLMVQAFRSAHNDKLAQMHGHYDKIDALAKDAGFNGIGDAARQLSGSLGKQDVKYVPVQVGEYDKIPLSAAMHLYAMDPQQRDRFINRSAEGDFADEKKGKPFLLTAKSFADAEAALTDGQKKLVDGVKAIIESRSDDLFAVHRRLKGYDPEKVKDYFPIRLNRDVVPSVPEDWKQHATRFLENAGLLKARERSSGEIPMLVGDFLGIALNHLESVENIIHLAEPTRNAHMVLRDTGVQRAVAERFGESAVNRVKQIITDASGTNEPDYDKVERFASKLTSNVSRSLTAANPSSWARQLGGLASLKTKMDAPTYAAGLKALSTAPASTARRMDQHPYFRQRYGENPSSRYSGVKEEGGTSSVPTRIILGAVGRAIAAGKPIDAAWRIAPKLFDKIRIANYFDMVSSIVAYGGFEAEARAAHPDWSDSKVAKYAGDKASEVIRETQNTHDLTDSNALMSYAAQNVWLKPFLAFTSDQSKQFNNLYQAYASGDTKRMMNTGIATAMNIVWGALVSAGSVGLVGEVVSVLTGRHGDDEERRRKAAEAAAWTFLRDSLGTAFPADRLVEAVRGWTAGGDSGLIDAPVAAVFDNINRAGKSVTDAVSLLTDKAEKLPGREAARQKKIVGKFTSALGDIAIGGSMAIGSPFPPIYWQVRKAIKAANEDGNKKDRR